MPYKEIENESVRQIVDKLQSLARETIAKNYNVASTSVTQQMVDAAQDVIDALANTINSVNDFNDNLLKLFTILPRNMYNVSSYLAHNEKDFNTIITREQNLLDVMRGQIYVPPVEEKHDDEPQKDITILEEFGLVMEEADRNDIAIIKTLMNESVNKFKRAWKVTNLMTQKRFDDFVRDNNITDTRLLFHGSRSENFWSIMKTGLVLRPTNAVITGKMFGYGVYYAPKCAKSIGYTSLNGSYWANGGSNVAYMALFDVAYGKPYNVYDFNSRFSTLTYEKLQGLCPGANCLHAHASNGMLRNDEIVVYKEEQMTIKYLIEIGN